MEAIMIAGLAVVVVGGWYSFVDLLTDLGITLKKRRVDVCAFSCRWSCSGQRRVKQMAGMNI